MDEVTSEPKKSRYVARWRHRDKLVLRCWPKWKLANNAILREKEIPINGIRIDAAGHPELWCQLSGTRAYVFEVSDEDFDLITAIPASGAKSGKMVVHAPGTADEKVKKECWLEVPLVIYADAFRKIITPWGRQWKSIVPHPIRGEDIEDALGMAGFAGSRYIFIESDDEIDEDVILREVVENDAFIVLNKRPWGKRAVGVTSRAGRKLVKKAMYWTVPGREPWEEGGIFRGYQFPDRILRFTTVLPPGRSEEKSKERIAKMHASTRAKGQKRRREYFLENVVTQFAERVGMSRQRVMSRFLNDGVVDWLMRSVDGMPLPGKMREVKVLLRARIRDAVNALEFYYRAKEAMENES